MSLNIGNEGPAIIYNNVDQVIWRHIASLSNGEIDMSVNTR